MKPLREETTPRPAALPGDRLDEDLTSLTGITLLTLLLAYVSKRGYWLPLAIAGATPAGVAIIAGGIAVPTFYTVAIGCLIFTLMRVRPTTGSHSSKLPTALQMLIAFLVVASVVTVFSPFLFEGLTVPSSAGRTYVLRPGLYSQTNTAQLAYLVLGVSVAIFAHRSNAGRTQWALAIIVYLPIILSLWAHLHTIAAVPYPAGLFDNSPTFVYQDRLPDGNPRVRGIFPEPAALGGACLAAISYGFARLPQIGTCRRILTIAVIASAVWLGAISTSTTFYVAGFILFATFIAVFALRFFNRTRQLSPLSLAFLFCSLGASAVVTPFIYQFITSLVKNKLDTSSYADRSGADSRAYEIFQQTHGFGVGLGAARASSILPSILGAAGLLGALLFFGCLIVSVISARRHRNLRPVIWLLSSLVVGKLIAGPDLSDTSGALWICIGILATAENCTLKDANLNPRRFGASRVDGRRERFIRSPRRTLSAP